MPSPKRPRKLASSPSPAPEGLRSALGNREIKVSLDTREPGEPKQRCTIEAARCDALFAKAQAGRITPERAGEIADAWRERIREDDAWNLLWNEVDAQ
jgi:hypothetical protein